MRTFLIQHLSAVILCAVWLALFFLSQFMPVNTLLCGRGIRVIGRAYYRLATGPFLHSGILHLSVNILAMLCVSRLLEGYVGTGRLLLFGLAAGTLAELVYALLCPTSENNIGGSVYVFAYLGLFVMLLLLRKDYPRPTWNSRHTAYLLGYAVLGNLPFIPMITPGTVITHACALGTGAALGLLALLTGVL